MKSKQNLLIISLTLIVAIMAIFVASRLGGLTTFAFWLVTLLSLGVLATLLYFYLRTKKKNEIVKCNNCGRTMIYSVLQKAGGCPRCHANLSTRTGEWPKA